MKELPAIDQSFLQLCTKEKFIHEFNLYLAAKTDTLTGESIVKLPMGADGIDYQHFKNKQDHQITSIIKRLHRGNYYFYPFREIIVSKDPKIKSPYQALKKGKERILSVASIRDVLIQKVLYEFLYPFAESKFSSLPLVSFAYRKGLNAPKAARKVYEHIQEGYSYALDGDIRKFFDKIPHDKLVETLKDFLGDSHLVYQLLYRFIHVDRIEWITYRNKEYKFKKEKLKRTKRTSGIPQGGILSGLIANLYLHPFDQWVIDNLGSRFPIRYIRYADDFIILTKDKNHLESIKEECSSALHSIGLELHTDPEKTKLIDLTKKGNFVNFVGFSISETGIRVRNKNIYRFKERINDILLSSELETIHSLKVLKLKIDYKFLGNEMKKRRCKSCGKFEVRRNWLSFFLTITDVQQLRSLDKWVSQQIHSKYYRDTKKRLPRKIYKELDFPSLEKLYYYYKKKSFSKDSICRCSPLEMNFIDTRDPYAELFGYKY